MPNDSESVYFPNTSKSFHVVPSHFQIKIVADLEVLRTGFLWEQGSSIKPLASENKVPSLKKLIKMNEASVKGVLKWSEKQQTLCRFKNKTNHPISMIFKYESTILKIVKCKPRRVLGRILRVPTLLNINDTDSTATVNNLEFWTGSSMHHLFHFSELPHWCFLHRPRPKCTIPIICWP